MVMEVGNCGGTTSISLGKWVNQINDWEQHVKRTLKYNLKCNGYGDK